MRLLLAALLLAAAASPAPPAPAPAGPVARDVVYAHRGAVELRLDLHHPPARPATGAPAIVWVHGGGFHSGTRQAVAPHARWFAQHGYVAATIDYRLRSRDEVRAVGYAAASDLAQQDAEQAVRWLRRRAARLGVDPGRIAIAGVSAGAITALNVAARARGDAAVRAAVSVSGFGPADDLGPGDPPVLLLHGTADRTVPFLRAAATCRAAQRAGARCRLVTFPGLGHRLGLTPVAGRVLRWLAREMPAPAAAAAEFPGVSAT